MSPPPREKELAPVACAMLRHSAQPGACIQQVVIRFHPDLDSESVVTAWKATVNAIDAATTLELHRPEMPDELLRASKMTKSLGPSLIKLLEERANQFEVNGDTHGETTVELLLQLWAEVLHRFTSAP